MQRMRLVQVLCCVILGCTGQGTIRPSIDANAAGAAALTPVASGMVATTLPQASDMPASGAVSAGQATPAAGAATTPSSGSSPAALPITGSDAPAAASPGTTAPSASASAYPHEWKTFNYDNDNSRNNRSETKITVANVAMLTQKWQRELQGGVSSTPQVVGGKVYVNDHGGSAYKLDAQTGNVEWRRSGLYAPRVGTNLVLGDVVLGAGGAVMYAMKIADGSNAWTARISDNPQTMIDSSPVQVGNLIVIGIASYEIISSKTDYISAGSVVAVNATTGAEVWRWKTTKNDATEGGGVSVWSSAAYDPELKMIWIGTGNPYEPPSPKTSNSLVALHSETGELVWFNQFHPDDVYTQPGGCRGVNEAAPNCDFDVGASPNLFTAQGKPAVGVGSKGGLFRVFERATGTMLWERKLGAASWWGGVMAVAATDDSTIYVANNNFMNGENLIALDMNTGDVKWMAPTMAAVWGALTLADGVLFTTGKDGMMRAYEAATGKELKAWDLGHDAASGVAVSDGVVYASSGFTGQGNVTRPGARVSAFSLP